MGLTGEEVAGAQPASESKAPLPQEAAARKRAAVEMIARHEHALKHTARRYSLCAEDAEDAYQRALEIVLTKAPTDQPRELIRWTHTVTKHEALAIRRNRERLLGTVPATPSGEDDGVDWVALIPAPDDGPDLRVERREKIARSREALQALKPAELRALTLLAEGYSYAEISEITGFSRTKVNRCLAEGRERFRILVSRSEDGSRCMEMGPLLSAFSDRETSAAETAAVREHLRACSQCRAALRSYRATPGAVAALAPVLPLSRSLLERVHDALAELHARLPGAGATADSAMTQVSAADGGSSAGLAALAKVAAICVGTAGGAAACVATGVVPTPLTADHAKSPTVERVSSRAVEPPKYEAVEYSPAPPPSAGSPQEGDSKPKTPPPTTPPEAAEAGAVEYAAPPPAPAPPPSSAGSPSGEAAGEFGP
ncbi:MAG: sigma-70 family RNA polymerase sigma factor [Solirubrobacterales bacterium]